MSEIRILRSSVIPAGFVHGFPERTGGVSTGPRASLNMGVRWGDDRANVDENRRRVAAAAGFAPEALQIMRHVHGTAVWRVGEPVPEPAEFDALVCDQVGPVLSAFAADCVPILFAEPEARCCGSAHAGWRGAVAGVAQNVVARLGELGGRPERVRVALGPSIGACCFEVGPEVVAAFHAAVGELPGLVVAEPRSAAEAANGTWHAGKVHLDLSVALRAMLERAGLRGEHIDASPPCTQCNPERFFSYRRDGREGGMHMGFIGLAQGSATP